MPLVMWFLACGRCLKARPRQIRGEITTECWCAFFKCIRIGGPVCDVLHRLTERLFLLGKLPGTFATLVQRLQAAVSRIASDEPLHSLRGAELQQESVVAVLTPPPVAEVLAACTLPLAARCYLAAA